MGIHTAPCNFMRYSQWKFAQWGNCCNRFSAPMCAVPLHGPVRLHPASSVDLGRSLSPSSPTAPIHPQRHLCHVTSSHVHLTAVPDPEQRQTVPKSPRAPDCGIGRRSGCCVGHRTVMPRNSPPRPTRQMDIRRLAEVREVDLHVPSPPRALRRSSAPATT